MCFPLLARVLSPEVTSASGFYVLYFKNYILTGNHTNCWNSGLSFSEELIVFLQKNLYFTVRSLICLTKIQIICCLMLVNTWV